MSDELKSLIDGLLKFNPETRLGYNGWDEVKKHSFFRDFDWEALQNQTIESPIKQLVTKYPVALKPYKP